MDLESHDEFSCSICFELFDEAYRCPRILTCGHSFCQTCLKNVLAQSPICPSCKQDIHSQTVDTIPVNFLIKSFVSRMTVSEKKDKEIGAHSAMATSAPPLPCELCEEHKNYVQLRCVTCQVWICRTCAMSNHNTCRTLSVNENLDDMRSSCLKKIEDEQCSQKTRHNLLNEKLQSLDDRRSGLMQEVNECDESSGKLLQEKREEEEISAMLKNFQISAAEASNAEELAKITDDLDILIKKQERPTPSHPNQNYPVPDQIVKSWLREGQTFYACWHVSSTSRTPWYGKVVMEGDEVFLYSFDTRPPEGNANIISFEELVYVLDLTGEVPHTQRSFLQLRNDDGDEGTVVVRTADLGVRARNFLLLCSGLRAHSYKGIKMDSSQGRSHGRRASYVCASHFPTVVEGTIRRHSSPRGTLQKGFVFGISRRDSWFGIRVTDGSRETSHSIFGEVESGFEFFQATWAKKQDPYIADCGLVFCVNKESF